MLGSRPVRPSRRPFTAIGAGQRCFWGWALPMPTIAYLGHYAIGDARLSLLLALAAAAVAVAARPKVHNLK